MASRTPCPHDKQLRDFALGHASPEDRAVVQAHLGTCSTCRSLVAALTGQDSSHGDGSTRHGEQGDTEATSDFELKPAPKDSDPQLLPFYRRILHPPSVPNSWGRLGKYDVFELLGQGGMGVVLLAEDGDMGRCVAIKLLSESLAHEPKERRRFLREARATAAISHPNVVIIHDADEQQGVPYLAMEFLDGGTLKEKLQKDKSLPIDFIVDVGRKIARGLAAAHEAGIVHRDIKPGNILLSTSGYVRIADFGLASVDADLIELTQPGRTMGTPPFMSPEQIHGTPLDARTDLFSFGCVLYAMVKGRSPFAAPTPMATAHKVTTVRPPRLNEVNPDVPAELADIVDRLLEKDADKRFKTATDVADALDKLYGELCIASERGKDPTEDLKIATARVRRGPSRAFAILPILLLVLLVAVFIALFQQRDTPQPSPDGVLTVDKSTSGSYRSISDALQDANSGSVVEVTDDSVYQESLLLNINGVTLRATNGATIRPSSEEEHSISIRDASGIRVAGFRIETPPTKHAIHIAGALDDIVIEGCQILRSVPGNRAAIQVFASRRDDTENKPLTIRNCEFEGGGPGQCIWIERGAAIADKIEIEHNLLHGEGTLITVIGPIRDLRIAHNVFAGSAGEGVSDHVYRGDVGLNLNLKQPLDTSRLSVHNNTFVGMRYWLGLFKTQPELFAENVLANNLILGSERMQGNAEQLGALVSTWQCGGNVWERSPDTRDSVSLEGRLAELVPGGSLELHSRTAGDPGYLRPRAESTLATEGLSDYASHVGAIAP